MPKSATSRTALPLTELRALLDYNLKTGLITWKVYRNSFGGRAKPGYIAGGIDKYGYRVIVINGLVYWAHRLAWFMYYERWPQHQIDHINMDPLDNRIENLRVATMTEQRANQRVRKDSKSGIKGVQKTRQGTWSARISKDGVTYRLGIFDAPEKAHIAYIKAAQTLFGKFARAA